MVEAVQKNNAIVYYPSGYTWKWLDAVGPTVQKFILNAGVSTVTAHVFVNTAVNASTVGQAITAGDKLLFTTAGAENDGNELQLVGTGFKFESGKPLFFEAKLSISDATQSDVFVGLAEKDTTLMSAHAMAVTNDAVGFYKLDGGTAIKAYNLAATVANITSVSTAMDTAKHTYSFYHDGAGNLSFFFDDSLVTTVTSGIPSVVMSPSIAFHTGEAGAKTALVESFRCIQLR